MELKEYKSVFLEYLSKKVIENSNYTQPHNLYMPIHYILQLGGKRIRPVLTLMSCNLFGGNINDALPAALSIEMFHNFTLIHDDIMDKAFLRRGKKTVHIKWDENIGILSGDALMILSSQILETYPANLHKELQIIFNKTALQICEGQQYDMDFENRKNVSINEYLKMVEYKTAVLVACSLKMGAIIADATFEDTNLIYKFGLNLGIAFQLQDDYLDAFGNKEIGKKIGGDIVENKKTFLIIKTLELASKEDKVKLLEFLSSNDENKISKVKDIITKYKVDQIIKDEIHSYTKEAMIFVESLEIENQKKQNIINFGLNLMNRNI